MESCSSCGSSLSPGDLACPFCKVVTRAGLERQQHAERERVDQAHYAAQAVAQQRAVAEAQVATTAKHALIWSVVGLVFCCLPLPSLIAAVLAFRARAAAKTAHVAAPVQTTIAIVLSCLSALSFVVLVVFGVTDAMRVARERDDLKKTIEPHVTAETLDHETACALVHLRLLDEGYGGERGDRVRSFDCPGKVTQSGDHATLEDVHFKNGSSAPPIVVGACLKRGARWLVEGVGKELTCGPASSKAPH